MAYTLASCEKLIETYVNDFKGQCLILEEGCLGLGKILLHSAEGKKTVVITERFVSHWSSTHTIRKYKKIPAKYEKMI